MQLVEELDDEYQDLLGLLDFSRPKPEQPKKKEDKQQQSYEDIALSLRNDMRRVQPVKAGELTEKEQAQKRKMKLMEAE